MLEVYSCIGLNLKKTCLGSTPENSLDLGKGVTSNGLGNGPERCNFPERENKLVSGWKSLVEQKY